MQAYNVTAVSLCGNLYLDPGEQCDTGSVTSLGCDATCQLSPTYICAGAAATCLFPCQGYVFAPTQQSFCSDECLTQPPTPGYTVDSHCRMVDIDECSEASRNNTCSGDAYCNNENGTYSCVCVGTYYGDGRTCHSTAYQVRPR